jgi:hypothetical protein
MNWSRIGRNYSECPPEIHPKKTSTCKFAMIRKGPRTSPEIAPPTPTPKIEILAPCRCSRPGRSGAISGGMGAGIPRSRFFRRCEIWMRVAVGCFGPSLGGRSGRISGGAGAGVRFFGRPAVFEKAVIDGTPINQQITANFWP